MVVALAVAAVTVLTASSAAAHTDLLAASPGPGQNVGGVVDFVDLVFTDPVSDAVVRISEPGGTSVTLKVTVDRGHLITVEMAALSAPGEYVVHYAMTSADGDHTEAEFPFAFHPDFVQPQRLGAAATETNRPTIVAWIASIVLAISLLGAVVLGLGKLERSRADGDTQPVP